MIEIKNHASLRVKRYDSTSSSLPAHIELAMEPQH
jgi:hypothetical protein